MRFGDHAARRIRRCAGDFACVGGGLSSERIMTEPRRRPSRMGIFRACPVPTVGPLAGLPKGRKRLLQGNNSEFSPIPPFCAKNRLENHRESSSLLDDPPKIPCAAEQGNNSTRTGKAIRENRELIRHNRESGAKSRPPDSRQMPSPSRIRKLSTLDVAKQPSPTDHKRPRAPLSW